MAKTDLMSNGCGPSLSPGGASRERMRYFARQLIGPPEMAQPQLYFMARMRTINRLIHGWGVVCGCLVRPGDDDWTVVIEPGLVLGPQGDEILIDEPVTVDISRQDPDGNNASACWGDPSGLDPWCATVRSGIGPADTIYLAIAYTECNTRPVRVQGTGCGCDDSACEYSRVRDSFVVRALREQELPKSYRDMSGGSAWPFDCPTVGVRECPPCPEEPWVILAQIKLSGKKIKTVDIDNNSYRRYTASFGGWWLKCGETASALLKIEAVRLLQLVDKTKPKDKAGVIVEVTDPTKATFFDPTRVDAIEVAFSKEVPVDFDTVVDSKTFIVRKEGVITSGGGTSYVNEPIAGRIEQMEATNSVRWLPGEDLAKSANLTLRLSLLGTGADFIAARAGQGGRPLDGEARSKFPSGDGREGGDFLTTLIPSIPQALRLQVIAVRLLKLNDESKPEGPATEIAVLKDATKPLKVPPNKADVIEVSFTREVPVDFDTIVPVQSFSVRIDDEILPGKIVPMKDENAIRWFLPSPPTHVGTRPVPLPSEVTLRGTGDDPIAAKEDGQALDGEPKSKLPSGDGEPGGNFTFRLAKQ